MEKSAASAAEEVAVERRNRGAEESVPRFFFEWGRGCWNQPRWPFTIPMTLELIQGFMTDGSMGREDAVSLAAVSTDAASSAEVSLDMASA